MQALMRTITCTADLVQRFEQLQELMEHAAFNAESKCLLQHI
jgi:hypothetical protein